MTELSRRIRMRMAELSLDQQALARLASTSTQVVRDLQRGNPRRYRPTTLVKVARALGWAPADLLDILSAPQASRDQDGRAPN